MSSKSQVKPAPVDYSSLGGSSEPKPSWTPSQLIRTTRSPDPSWKYGSGATDNGFSLAKDHVEIDPFAPGRPMFHNFSLLVSGIVPRPIGFTSTVSVEGKENLAPFSYFQCVDHDPPVFVIGFSGRADRPKDTQRNLEETGECVLNVVSEHMIEAVNATSLDPPHGVSEWDISGLHRAASTTVKPARVKEAVFAIEGKLVQMVGYQTSSKPAGPHGKLAIVEGTRFWAREDALDEERRKIDLEVLRPVAQLGGIAYSRVTDTFELARSNWVKATAKDAEELAKLTGSGKDQ